jgi:hypothetical protein
MTYTPDYIPNVRCGHAHGGNTRLVWGDDRHSYAQCCGCGQFATAEQIENARYADAGAVPGGVRRSDAA